MNAKLCRSRVGGGYRTRVIGPRSEACTSGEKASCNWRVESSKRTDSTSHRGRQSRSISRDFQEPFIELVFPRRRDRMSLVVACRNAFETAMTKRIRRVSRSQKKSSSCREKLTLGMCKRSESSLKCTGHEFSHLFVEPDVPIYFLPTSLRVQVQRNCTAVSRIYDATNKFNYRTSYRCY